MSVLKLGLVTGRPVQQLEKLQIPGGKQAIGQKVLNFLQSLVTGTEIAADSDDPPSLVIIIQDNEVRASGTFTLTSVVATNTVSVNGVTFTAIASGATGNQFNVGVSDILTAGNLASTIRNSVSPLIHDYVSVSNNGTNVVTIQAEEPGPSGNTMTISSGQGTIVASGARLTGGAPDPGELDLTF